MSRRKSRHSLYCRGEVAHIVTTGGRRHVARAAEGVAHRDVMLGLGVPADAIRLDDRSTSTVDNVLAARALLGDRGPIVAVTAIMLWYHRRAVLTLARHLTSLERIGTVTTTTRREEEPA